jgi:DNA polymerase-3 subunit gamma/tau
MLVARVRKERPLISEWIEAGKLVEIHNGTAVLAFPPGAGLARDSCERANNRTFLEKMLAELSGRSLSIKTESRDGLVVEKLAREEARPEAKADPMEAFKNDPLIQKALAEFKAEILPA